jgi:hypothetical protein
VIHERRQEIFPEFPGVHDVEAELFFRQQAEEGFVSSTAGVKERPPVVDVALEETVCDPRHGYMLGKVLPVHLAHARLR